MQDTLGNAFWVKHLKGRERVSWDRFATEVCQYVSRTYVGCFSHLTRAVHRSALAWGAPDALDKDRQESLRYFRYMVGVPLPDVQSPPREVTLEGFGRVMSWFGPMDNKGEFLTNIKQAMTQEWFHGPMTSKEAEKALANRKKGTFLVRLSATGDGVFRLGMRWGASAVASLTLRVYGSVSRVGSTGISHQRMTYGALARLFGALLGVCLTLCRGADAAEGFTLKYTQGKTAKKIKVLCTLPVFVVKHLMKELKLAVPCAGSPYGFLYGAGAKHEKNCDVDG